MKNAKYYKFILQRLILKEVLKNPSRNICNTKIKKERTPLSKHLNPYLISYDLHISPTAMVRGNQ